MAKEHEGLTTRIVELLKEDPGQPVKDLAKIAEKRGIKAIAERAQVLATRARFGVKKDLVESRLVFLNGIGRVCGRLLHQRGFGLEELSRSRPSDLVGLLGDLDLCRAIVEESRKVLKNEKC